MDVSKLVTAKVYHTSFIAVSGDGQIYNLITNWNQSKPAVIPSCNLIQSKRTFVSIPITISAWNHPSCHRFSCRGKIKEIILCRHERHWKMTITLCFRYSDPMPPGTLMPFQQVPEPPFPENIYCNQNGFNVPPRIPSGGHTPHSPGMSSGGIPSPGPGPVMSPMV